MIGTWGRVRGMSWSSAWIGCGLLVGPDGDGGERRDQEPRVEHRFYDGKHVGVHRDLLEGGAVDEQVVHPHGAHPLEEVVGGDGSEVVLQLEQCLVDLVHQLRLDGIGEDGVAVLGDPRQVGFQVRERVDGAAAGFDSRWVSQAPIVGRIRPFCPGSSGTEPEAELARW